MTGPGLPANGRGSRPRATGRAQGDLEIPTGTLTSVNNRVNGGMSTAYKWASTPISGSTTSFSPNELPEYVL
ncbi:hypothetical protein [Trinickia mobilis]|uniref:hypothetical protein n=1 Tax=Trinickia mobilis TaxID=2816356 RepID=UPI001F5DC969|nr:hypothetical protein [Trinickia mobilis]